ncbi:uncharacterized protein PAC_10650 [Phialocephala subalpina]|uniref:DUF7580 domain-containing protein n=1 Tax=Phialocephala subalpina TaxID=576137 RepID=A0A1L7X6U6_9HELO|nr:uncharacterized protein PAC_10650 [Phialocephala subalpina]
MSGAEAVGLVLGILPLLISTAEHYRDVLKPFKRYQNFAPELEIYQLQLNNQKTIFHSECRWLLTALTDSQMATDMLRESTHPSWGDKELDEKCAQQLGDSGTCCKETIALIQAKLKVMEKEAESFALGIQHSIPLGSMGNKDWRARVGKKLKFSFSGTHLDKSLQELRRFNEDFRTLAKQASRLTKYQERTLASADVPLWNEQAVEECSKIHKASEQLCGLFERACQLHTEHSIHFCLESPHISVEDTGSLVRFNMAFGHRASTATTMFEPTWITVDSFVESETKPRTEDDRTLPQKSYDGLVKPFKNPKHEMPAATSIARKKIKTKSVSFAAAVPCSAVSSKSAFLPSFLIDPTLPDFGVQQDFCKQLQQRYSPQTPENKYLGYLQKSGPCKHLVYFAPPISTCGLKQSVSLAQMILKVSKTFEADRFLQYERLRLAKQLASAVLRFHATPLLKESWRSRDIIFFGPGSSLASPHLNVHVGSSQTQPQKKPITNQTFAAGSSAEFRAGNSKRHGIIRNSCLFHLGLILIELAYQLPLENLRVPSDSMNGEGILTDFYAASRLSHVMGASMGVTYAKVVRKCLGCEFGEGTDLTTRSLQTAFYKEVVCELERLEREFARLQLAS